MRQQFYCLLWAIAIMAITGCKKDAVTSDVSDAPVQSRARATFINTFYGPQVQLGDGHVRSFVRINHDDVPIELGIVMTPDALQNLPVAPAGAMGEFPFDYLVPLHQKAADVTPFDHINVDWQPIGHPPPGIFSIPHFDIHFYMMSVEEQLAIPAPTPQNAHLFAAPPAGYLPADYVIPGPPVPQMGKHWLDRTSPTLPPTLAPFTHEWIYGTFDGKVTYYEPMVTRALLLSGTEVHKAIKQPAIFDPVGTYYPTRYNIYTDSKDGKIYVSLDQFVWR